MKIKHKRFGSMDRESNFLVETVSDLAGQVTVLNDKDSVKKELNQQTKGSAQVAVLVLRAEDKAQAQRSFQAPLIFSIHEAKGPSMPRSPTVFAPGNSPPGRKRSRALFQKAECMIHKRLGLGGSAKEYVVIRKSLAQPEPLRLRYRSQLHELVADIVRKKQPIFF